MALPHSLNIFDYPARFQFGQAGAPCGGSSCCTDTCMQMIVEYYKEKHYSLADIRRAAQKNTNFNESPCTGINHIEVINGLQNLGINHYKAGFGVDASDVVKYLTYGPVIVGVYYGSYPNRVGRCGSNKAEISGRTDCGFTGAHAVLAISQKMHGDHRDFFIRDPDHNSPSRQEKPDFDRITAGQLNLTMRNLPRYTKFSSTYIVYPTRKKTL